MPRKARLSPPASFFHVMARGIEGRDIFCTDEDRRRFLSLLTTGLNRTGFACYAWALMKNHYHLLLRSSEQHLSQLMRPLNAAYAQSYSKAHNRSGYLFQDRYKSLVTQDQGYGEELVRYVHANPLRAGVCKSLKELDNYPWTGHAVLMGNLEAEFQQTWPVLHKFGRSADEGRRGYAAFMASDSQGSEAMLPTIRKGNVDRDRSSPGAYVIGDPDFVQSVLNKDKERRFQITRHRLEGLSIEDLADKFAIAAGITTDELRRRGRANYRADARKVFAYVCHRMYGFTAVEIARYVGCTQPPVTIAARQGENVAKTKVFAKVLKLLRPQSSES